MSDFDSDCEFDASEELLKAGCAIALEGRHVSRTIDRMSTICATMSVGKICDGLVE